MDLPSVFQSNCTITFQRETGYSEDPVTGEVIPVIGETLSVECFLNRVAPAADDKAQMDQNILNLEGVVRSPKTLPAWIVPGMREQPAVHANFGEGLFNYSYEAIPNHPFANRVAGQRMHGTFRITGAGQ